MLLYFTTTRLRDLDPVHQTERVDRALAEAVGNLRHEATQRGEAGRRLLGGGGWKVILATCEASDARPRWPGWMKARLARGTGEVPRESVH